MEKILPIYNQQEREKRVLAMGEHSNHCHVIIGGVVENHTIIVDDNNAVIKHLVMDAWINFGRMEWTGEHTDIVLPAGRYKIVHQQVIDPITQQKRRAID